MAYENFLIAIQTTESVWYLRGLQNEDPLETPSHELDDRWVMPFWSERAYCNRAKQHLELDDDVVALPLQRFQEVWLPRMIEERLLVGPNWDKSLAGLEVEPSEILRRLEASKE